MVERLIVDAEIGVPLDPRMADMITRSNGRVESARALALSAREVCAPIVEVAATIDAAMINELVSVERCDAIDRLRPWRSLNDVWSMWTPYAGMIRIRFCGTLSAHSVCGVGTPVVWAI